MNRMTSASETTERLKRRVLYADRIVQQTIFDRGLKSYIVLEGGSTHGATTYVPYHHWVGGAVATTESEVEYYKASVPGGATGPTTTVPDVPTSVSAIEGDAEATITFTAPTNDGGASITSYTVISNPGGITATGSSSPITVSGLSNGTSYTFTVIATNSVGNSAASTPSNAVTPAAPIPRTPGVASLAATFFDNANIGYTTLYNTFSRMTADNAQNTIIAGLYRTNTLTLNAADTDGISQIPTFTEAFDGTTGITQGATYYASNIFVAKYTEAGVPTWSAKVSGTTNAGMSVFSVACDSQNNVYALVGASGSTGTPNVVSFYNADNSLFGSKSNVFGYGNFTPARFFIVKYNASGAIQWINSMTAGDNNNQFLLLNDGHIAVDGEDNVYVSTQMQRAGGGTGPSKMTFYSFTGVAGSDIQDAVQTSDSYPFMTSPFEYQRGHLIKLTSSGVYTWIARMSIPSAWGENNGGGVNGNIVFDSNNNVYVCQNTVVSASSPICNVYSGIAATSNPLPTIAAPYYRIDLRGNSISPSAPQYHQYVAILKFSPSGAFQRAACVHQLRNGSVPLSMAGFIGINPTTNELYMTVNAQGYVGTNAMSGAQLNKLYVDSFSQNAANGSNYDVVVANTFNVALAQPQTILGIVKFDADLQAQSVAYVDVPGNGSQFNTNNPVNLISVDSSGNVYITTTIKDTAAVKTVYTFNALSGSDTTFTTFGTVSASSAAADGLVVSFNGALTTGRWATVVASSDGLNDAGLSCVVNSNDYVFIGGTSTLDKTAGSNTLAVKSYAGVSGGAIQNTLFGSIDVSAAEDRVGFLIRYE